MAKKANNQERKDYTTRNTLTVGLFAGAMVGFYVAMWLGVFNYSGDDSTTDWVLAVTAIAAAFISGLAVVLVAQTLKATRDTLDATREMVEKQDNASYMQLRAWVYIDSIVTELHGSNGSRRAKVTFKNFGNTPATELVYKTTVDTVSIPLPLYDFPELGGRSVSAEVPPTKEFRTSTDYFKIPKSGNYIRIAINWQYKTYTGKRIGFGREYIYNVKDDEYREVQPTDRLPGFITRAFF